MKYNKRPKKHASETNFGYVIILCVGGMASSCSFEFGNYYAIMETGEKIYSLGGGFWRGLGDGRNKNIRWCVAEAFFSILFMIPYYVSGKESIQKEKGANKLLSIKPAGLVNSSKRKEFRMLLRFERNVCHVFFFYFVCY